MVFVLILIVIVVAIWWESVRRGRRFVRAFAFLTHLDDGDDVTTANRCATSMVFTRHSDPDADRSMALRAQEFARAHTNGKQLPIIALARSKGFCE